MSERLEKARRYELLHEKNISRQERPEFHLSPRVGWMNDPNGFSWYDGKYHLFYQYYPYESKWGPMHWGHAVSSDLLHWGYLPAVMCPDQEYDSFGVFSGSAETLADGRHLLMYTGVRKESRPHQKQLEYQVQCVAVGDGVDYEKYEGNPVITTADAPEGSSVSDFRDPKIWKKSDGSFAAIATNRGPDGSARLLLYTSIDGFHWEYQKIFMANDFRYGNMWECPDFVQAGDKWLLLVSPMEMRAKEPEFPNGRGVICFVGSYDEVTDTFTEESCQIMDSGIDFYASQSIRTPDGRAVMVGWMQSWDTCEFHQPKDEKWFGQMSLPRELTVRNGRVCQQPVRELEGLRRNRTEHTDVALDGWCSLPGVSGRCVDMEITVRPTGGSGRFAVRFAQDDHHHVELIYRPEEGLVRLDRRYSGSPFGVIHERECSVEPGELKLRMVLDRFSAEIFLNGGEKVMTVTCTTPLSADGIRFFGNGNVQMDVTKYDLMK